MSKSKKYSYFNPLIKTNDGVILISMSLGIFLIISIFTFFLMKLVVKENNMSLYHALDIKTRNLAHSAMGRGIFQFGNLRNIASQSGILNNGNYDISYNGITDETDDPLPYSHYTMLKSDAEISDSQRKTRLFLSSFPSGFNPAFYGENMSNQSFNNDNINGGYLVRKNENLFYNGTEINTEGIKESMPQFNNMYDDEIIWTQNNVEINSSNPGDNPNNKFLNFDGNDYVKVVYSNTTTTTTYETTTTTIPGTTTNYTATFEGKSGSLSNSGYMSMNWHSRFHVLNGSSYSGSGYQTAVTSGTQVAYNAWNEQNVYFESTNGSEFDFRDFYSASAWYNSQTLYVRGYKNGSQKYNKSFTIYKTTRQKLTCDFYDVDKIVFSNSGNHVAFDNFRWTKTTPSTTSTTTTPVTTSTTTTTLPKFNENRTFVAWVKPSDDHNTAGGILTSGTGDCDGKMFAIGRSGGKLFFWGGCKDWTSNLTIPKDQWSFIAITYNGSKVRAFVNGVWEETTLNGFNTQISELFIGGETTNNGSSFRNYFRGGIDEVAVWNKALANSEILALYNNRAGLDASSNSGDYISENNLRGYWKFNNGNGSSLSDNSGNGKNGTNYGATWNTGSHTQSQIGPLVFNSGTQLNLNSPNCGSDHTSICVNNKIAVNQNIIFNDTDISGTGIIVATGKITINQNSTVGGGITFIANDIEINDASLGNPSLFNSSSGPVIIYTENGGLISNSNNISGFIINNDLNSSSSFTINNSIINGAILNYSSNFILNNNTNIVGSIVSNYLVEIDNSSSITKGNLPSFYGKNIGLNTSVIPGSYLEY
jgi:hypothetical protein